MSRSFDRRAGHYLLLLAVWALGCLPNLGGPALWDIDEGLNAEAAREMLASGNLVVPTFNYQLRSAKPALLYWLQAGCYRLLGVNEAAARLPSALAVLLAVLGAYELGRAMFTRHAALLAGVVLATTAGVLGAGHFANPDALLLAWTTWTLGLYFRFWQTGRGVWLYGAAAACGLGVLAKGPVALLLPAAVVVGFLLWQRQLRRLLDLRVAEASVVFLLVAAPWYVWVTTETKGQFLREFWRGQHLQRVTTVLEKHGGSPAYYVLALTAGLLPWSIFLAQAILSAWSQARREEGRPAVRFLVVWFGIWFVAFSVAQTKLPNYVLPLYPAAALLIGDALDRWRRGELAVPGWMMRGSLVCLALVGVVTTATMLVVGGYGLAALPAAFRFPELLAWWWLGLIPLAGAAAAWRLLRRGRRGAVLGAVAATAALFLGGIAGGVLEAFNGHKPASLLARALPGDHEYREVRLAALGFDRPSLVFYCRREVRWCDDEAAAAFLRSPLPAYLFVPEARWRALEGTAPRGARVLACYPDLYARGGGVVVVANAASADGG